MEEYLSFFNNYTKHYMQIAKNDFQKVHINRKIEHSKRVNKFSIEIAKELKLEENEQYIINIASLLHDIGRFEQFYKYSTYVDKDSVNHALLGCQILEEKQILNKLKEDEKNTIIEIIKMHNYKELPKDISQKLYLLASIIRDADKIDWLYAMVNIIPNLSQENQAVFYSNKPEKNYISKELVNLILNDQKIARSNLTTRDELRVSGIAWITSDINCTPSYNIIKKEDLINKTYKLMKDSEEKKIIFDYIYSYMNKLN